jgi:hypothetical protein
MVDQNWTLEENEPNGDQRCAPSPGPSLHPIIGRPIGGTERSAPEAVWATSATREPRRAWTGKPEFDKSRDEESRDANCPPEDFERMQLLGLSGVRDEFHLAAIVQNLKTPAKHTWRPPPAAMYARTGKPQLRRSMRAIPDTRDGTRALPSKSPKQPRSPTLSTPPVKLQSHPLGSAGQ